MYYSKMSTRCELCKAKEARMHCESDQASLCWDCDASVHSANFLVARHSRNLLCRICQSPTPWSASGDKLRPIFAVCEQCVDRRSEDDEVAEVVEENHVAEEEESSSSGDEMAVMMRRRKRTRRIDNLDLNFPSSEEDDENRGPSSLESVLLTRSSGGNTTPSKKKKRFDLNI